MADGKDFPSQSDLIATPGTLGQPVVDEEAARRALDVVAALRTEFVDRDKVLADIEKIIFLENEVFIPKGYEKTAMKVKSPLPSHIVNTITSALSVNPPSVQFDHPAIGDAAEENQALRESFFDASWQRQEQEARRPLFRQFCHATIGYGEGIIKTVERKKRAWTGYNAFSKKTRAELDDNKDLDDDSKDRVYNERTEEFKRGAAYPIASTDIPPGSFYYSMGEDGMSVACEVKQIPYYDAVERFSVGIDKQGNVVPEAMGLSLPDSVKALDGKRTLTMSEIWMWDKVTYVLQGAKQLENKKGLLVKTIKHGYGDKELKVLRGPYFHSMGVTTSSREIYKQSQGVLFAFLHLFPLLDQLLTIRGQAAVTYGFPAFKRRRPPEMGLADSPFATDAAERDGQDEEIRPGYVYPYDIEPVNMPSGGIDLDKAIADVRAMIELALPSAAQGVVGGESGYAINQAAHLARLAWNPIIANIEQTLSDRVAFESWVIENRIKEKVYVYGSIPEELQAPRKRKRPDEGWLGIDGDDLKGLHRYRVRLAPETPSNEVIKIRMLNDQLKMGVISQRMAIEQSGQNPTQVRRELMYEGLINDPAIKNMIKQGVFQRLATLQQEAMQGVDAAPPGEAPTPDAQNQMAPPSNGLAALVAGGQAGPPGAVPPGAGQPPTPQPPVGAPGIPGTVAGYPGGVRNMPANSQPLPGQ